MEIVVNNSERTRSEYDLVMSLPDKSLSFQHGFEAGSIWTMLKLHSLNLGSVDSPIKLQAANVESFKMIATHMGYSVAFTEHPENGYVNAVFTLGLPQAKLSVVKTEG